MIQGDDRNANQSPRGAAGHWEHQQPADHMRAPNGVADDPSFFGSHHARLAKSKSTVDLPTRLQEAWPERQVDQEVGMYYQDTGNRAGHPSYAERGPSERFAWPSTTTRSAEDAFRRSQPDFRAGQQPTWDAGDRRHSGRHQQALPGYVC